MIPYRLILMPLFFLLPPAGAVAADFRVVPSIGVSEEVNDNIRQVPHGARLELVTRVMPGAALRYEAPAATVDASYNLDYRYYARNTRGSEVNHAAALKGAFGLWHDFLTLETTDSYSRVSLDLARDTTQESVLVDQTDRNVFTVSPFLSWHPGGKSTLKTGYRFSDTRYWQQGAIDKQVHAAFADFSQKVGERTELTAGYLFSRFLTSESRYQRHDLSCGVRHEFRRGSFLYGSIGNSWYDYASRGGTSNLFWNAGLSNDFGVAVATVEARVHYTEDPLTVSTKQTDYSVSVEKALQRGRVGISATYSEYETVEGGSRNRDRYQLIVGGSHEVLPSLTAALAFRGERLSNGATTVNVGDATANLPYHLVANGSLSYTVGEGVTLTGSYSHISYRQEIDSSAGSVEVNRGIVEMRKTF